MSNLPQYMISIAPQHAENIMEGRKTVELRRRPPGFAVGTRFWIYETKPVASLVGSAVLTGYEQLELEQLWNEKNELFVIERADFEAYFSGLRHGWALSIGTPKRLDKWIHLSELRLISPGFHPPQYYMKFDNTDPVWHRLTHELVGNGESSQIMAGSLL